MSDKIPIFVITSDMIEVLKQSLQSYEEWITTPYDISIIDFGTTYPPTLEYLKKMEAHGTKVFWGTNVVVTGDWGSQVNIAVKEYFAGKQPTKYVVTDCDVAFQDIDGEILKVFSCMLDEIGNTHEEPGIGKIHKVMGITPLMDTDNIPPNCPTRVGGDKHAVLWNQKPYIYECKTIDKKVPYIYYEVDSHFTMRRAGAPYHKRCKVLRTNKPYHGQHLSWHRTPDNITEDYVYYIDHMTFRGTKYNHWYVKGRKKK